MTAWKQRALLAEHELSEARRELGLFYSVANTRSAIDALHRLRAILRVDVPRSTDVPDKLTVTVDYQLDARPTSPGDTR